MLLEIGRAAIMLFSWCVCVCVCVCLCVGCLLNMHF